MGTNLRPQDIDDQQAPEFNEQFLLARLISAKVGSIDDWQVLSPRAKRSIFGITARMARALDEMAKARQRSRP
jgi:hypothetical protein